MAPVLSGPELKVRLTAQLCFLSGPVQLQGGRVGGCSESLTHWERG